MKILISSPRNYLRLAIIPVLCLVLIVVLMWPKAGDPVEGTEVEPPTILVSTRHATNTSNVAKKNWPTADFADVIAFDPFQPRPAQALPEINSAAGALAPATENAPDPLSLGKLQAVFTDARGSAAIFESRVIHVGDRLADGMRVVAITGQGIVLQQD